MNFRLFFVVMFILVFGVINAALLWEEGATGIVETDSLTRVEAKKSDPLFGMVFEVATRESNLLKMGFTEKEVEEILKKLRALEQRLHTTEPERNLVAIRIGASSDQDGLLSAFCGASSTLPVRYAAMQYLVQEKGTQLTTKDIEAVSSLEAEDWWVKSGRVEAAYREADLSLDRKDDAVRMILAAVLERQETLLLDGDAPWGRSLFSGWSWESVQKKFPGVKGRVVDYTATMHLVLEVATGEQGICAPSEGSREL